MYRVIDYPTIKKDSLLNLVFSDINPPPLPLSSSDSGSVRIEPPTIDLLPRIISNHRDQDYFDRQKSLSTLRRAHPPPLTRQLDPILTVPTTSKQRHSLVKWRTHWLPSYPFSPCLCDNASAATSIHYTTACLKMESITIHCHCHLPSVPDQINIIDHFLNLLPKDHTETQHQHSHWQRTWPLILSALLTIDINSHPGAAFDSEPDYHPWLTSHHTTILQSFSLPRDFFFFFFCQGLLI